MSRGGITPQKAVDLTYIELKDFTAGIHKEAPSGMTGPAPDGAAVGISPDGQRETAGCYGHPNGGLAPLARRVDVIYDAPVETDIDTTHWPDGQMEQVVLATEMLTAQVKYGATTTAEIEPANPDQLHILWGWHHIEDSTVNPAPNIAWRIYNRFLPTPTVVAPLIGKASGGTFTGPAIFASGSLFKAQIEGEAEALPVRATPRLCVVVCFGDRWTAAMNNAGLSGSQRRVVAGIYEWPQDPDDLSGTKLIATDADLEVNTPFGFYHQGRIVSLVNAAQGVLNATGEVPSNETMIYTAAFSSALEYDESTNPNAFTVVGEAMSGIVLYGSTNASELLLVKNTDGGIVIRGDIANPSVVDLPGVASAKGAGALGAKTPVGHVYGTRDGVWSWSGGDSVDLLSPQLEGWFWRLRGTANDHKVSTMPKGKFGWSYPFVYVTANWVYDVRTKAWFRLTDYSDTEHLNYEVSSSGRVYGVVPSIPAGTTDQAVIAEVFDPELGTDTYTWLSHPLARTRTRTLEFRQVVLKAQGTGHVVVTLVGASGEEQGATFNIIDDGGGDEVQVKTCNVALRGTDVSVYVSASSGDANTPAPRIHSIALGYQEVQSTAAVN